MLITRKAAVGFILLAVITLAVTSYDPVVPKQDKFANITANISIPEFEHPTHTMSDQDTTVIITKPAINFGKYNPLVITAILEVFTLGCYLVLKRIEPRIVAWETAEREKRKGNLK